MKSLLFSGGRLIDISCLLNIINVIGQCFFLFSKWQAFFPHTFWLNWCLFLYRIVQAFNQSVSPLPSSPPRPEFEDLFLEREIFTQRVTECQLLATFCLKEKKDCYRKFLQGHSVKKEGVLWASFFFFLRVVKAFSKSWIHAIITSHL